MCPWGIRQAINWATREYGAPDIYITENGFRFSWKTLIASQIFCSSDRLGNIDDLQRIYYYKHYLNQENSPLFHSFFYILKAGAEGNQVGWDLSEGLLRLEPP